MMAHAHLETENKVVQERHGLNCGVKQLHQFRDGGLCLSGGWQYFSAFRGWVGAVHRTQEQKGMTDNKPTAANNLTVAVSSSQPRQGSANVCVCVPTSGGASSSNFSSTVFSEVEKQRSGRSPSWGWIRGEDGIFPKDPDLWGSQNLRLRCFICASIL